ncbi:MAG: hypothetical protein ICV73_12455 [Acetobacteraceae bacterium]|nr:hypothetical protein [Acetobacteraceae bacterium]
MATLHELLQWYGRTPRPANIGDRVGGVALAELEDEIQDAAGGRAGLDAEVAARRAARLGLALAEVTRLLPDIQPAATRAYFARLADLARAALAEIAAREA